jgi:murein DD-endopeptidase MepM/ murein hydrolase activator NlpD
MASAPAYGRPGRARRRPARKPRRSHHTAAVIVITLAFLVVVMLAAFSSSPSAFRSAVPASSTRLLPSGPPRPQVVALQGTLRLQLPIAQQMVTAVGYHAAGAAALPLEPLGRQANEGLFSRIFHKLFGGGGKGLAWYQLGGGAGSSTGAVDIGAPAGTDVYAPVNGTIVTIQDYVVDGRPYGNVIDIEPAGSPNVVVALSHVRVDPSLAVGAPLAAGSSKVGTVLDFSGVERQALARHTQDAGNHVTLAVQPAATLSS